MGKSFRRTNLPFWPADDWGALQGIADLLPKLLAQQADELQQAVTEDEIRNAIMQMAPLKAPRPDGIPAGFYQKHWESVGPDVIKAV